LYYEAFPTQSKQLKVKDWKNFYKVRHVAIREQGKDRSHPIGNFSFFSLSLSFSFSLSLSLSFSFSFSLSLSSQFNCFD
jgi:hypothetical protein